MDDPKTHEEVIEDIEDDLQIDDQDDALETPADTSIEDEPKKETAAEVAERQALKWAKDISEGKRTLEEMPENLNWLKPQVEAKLPKYAPEPQKSEPKIDLETQMNAVLEKREAQKDFDRLVNDLEDAGVSEEKNAELKEAFEDLMDVLDPKNPVHRLKALKSAVRAVGIQDKATLVANRRKEGATILPLGSKRRTVQAKDEKHPAANSLDKHLDLFLK